MIAKKVAPPVAGGARIIVESALNPCGLAPLHHARGDGQRQRRPHDPQKQNKPDLVAEHGDDSGYREATDHCGLGSPARAAQLEQGRGYGVRP